MTLFGNSAPDIEGCLHLQECFVYLGDTAGDFPEPERAVRETLALPIHPGLTPDQQAHVVESVRDFYKA